MKKEQRETEREREFGLYPILLSFACAVDKVISHSGATLHLAAVARFAHRHQRCMNGAIPRRMLLVFHRSDPRKPQGRASKWHVGKKVCAVGTMWEKGESVVRSFQRVRRKAPDILGAGSLGLWGSHGQSAGSATRGRIWVER